MDDTRLKMFWCDGCEEWFYTWHMDRVGRDFLYCVKCGHKVDVREQERT